MTVNERQRLELYGRLGETLGREHAEVLMEYLPPVGWNDVARHHDVVLLRADLGILRADLDILRAEMHTGFADLRTEMHEQFSRQLVWLMSAIFASVGAILGMIAYVN